MHRCVVTDDAGMKASSTPPQIRRIVWKWARIALSGAALLWIFARTPLQTVISVLQSANPWMLVAGVCLNVATRLAAAERTHRMNGALAVHVSRTQNVVTLFISNFYALLSPGPWLSGAVTVYRYHHLGATLTGSVSSLLASRAVEAAAFVFWGVTLALLDARLDVAAARVPLQWGVAALAMTAAAVAAWWALHRRQRARIARGCSSSTAPGTPAPGGEHSAAQGSWSRLRGRITGVWRHLLLLGPAVALRAFLPATAQVFIAAAGLALLAHSVQAPMSWTSAVWTSAAVYGAVLLPVSVAGFGVREFTLIGAFKLLGFEPRQAVAVSLLLFLDMLVSGCIGAVLQATVSTGRARARAVP